MEIVEAIEAIEKAAHRIGEAVGLEQAASCLFLRAGESFVRGQDSDACTLREIANELEAFAAPHREQWELELHQAAQDAWAFLNLELEL